MAIRLAVGCCLFMLFVVSGCTSCAQPSPTTRPEQPSSDLATLRQENGVLMNTVNLLIASMVTTRPEPLGPGDRELLQGITKSMQEMAAHPDAIVNKEKYDAVVLQRDLIADQLSEAEQENKTLQAEIAALKAAGQASPSTTRP